MRLSPLLRLAAAALATSTICPHAQAAEWTQLPGPASSGVTVYTDVASERSRHGRVVGFFLPNPRQAWFITDYATPHRWKLFQIGSSKQLIEFDCKRSSMRVLARLYYEGAMAQGRVLASEAPARESALVIPGDLEEAMHQSACRPTAEEAREAARAAQKDIAVAPPQALAATAAPTEAWRSGPDGAAASAAPGAMPDALPAAPLAVPSPSPLTPVTPTVR